MTISLIIRIACIVSTVLLVIYARGLQPVWLLALVLCTLICAAIFG